MSDEAKRRFYQKSEVVSHYDDWRFGGPGGAYVNERELQAVTDLLATMGKNVAILDLPCGTGRLSERLLSVGYWNITCADYSPEMIRIASGRLPSLTFSREDALGTTFPSASYDAVVCLRFSFHTPDLRALLQELSRLLKPDGIVVLDVLRWSPRTLVPGLDRRLGGRLWTWSDSQILEVAASIGFDAEKQFSMLLIPSFAYRHLPAFVVTCVHALEKVLPQALRSKSFWRLRRSAESEGVASP